MPKPAARQNAAFTKKMYKAWFPASWASRSDQEYKKGSEHAGNERGYWEGHFYGKSWA